MPRVAYKWSTTPVDFAYGRPGTAPIASRLSSAPSVTESRPVRSLSIGEVRELAAKPQGVRNARRRNRYTRHRVMRRGKAKPLVFMARGADHEVDAPERRCDRRDLAFADRAATRSLRSDLVERVTQSREVRRTGLRNDVEV